MTQLAYLQNHKSAFSRPNKRITKPQIFRNRSRPVRSVFTGQCAGPNASVAPDGSYPARPAAAAGSCPSSGCSPPRSQLSAGCTSARSPSRHSETRRSCESDGAERERDPRWAHVAHLHGRTWGCDLIPTSSSFSLVEYWLVTPVTMCAMEWEPRSNLKDRGQRSFCRTIVKNRQNKSPVRRSVI